MTKLRTSNHLKEVPLDTWISAASPPPLINELQSAVYLVYVRTPSTDYYDLACYDMNYRQDRPWRTVHNHGVAVTHYRSLPKPP